MHVISIWYNYWKLEVVPECLAANSRLQKYGNGAIFLGFIYWLNY